MLVPKLRSETIWNQNENTFFRIIVSVNQFQQIYSLVWTGIFLIKWTSFITDNIIFWILVYQIKNSYCYCCIYCTKNVIDSIIFIISIKVDNWLYRIVCYEIFIHQFLMFITYHQMKNLQFDENLMMLIYILCVILTHKSRRDV